jgi:hypothetical protein
MREGQGNSRLPQYLPEICNTRDFEFFNGIGRKRAMTNGCLRPRTDILNIRTGARSLGASVHHRSPNLRRHYISE